MKIEMMLLSDAIPGSGEGIAGIIDSDIVYDEFGIPYIPAKRIKGILRESARDLLDVGKLSKAQIDALFGVRGDDKGTDLKISDGFIADYKDVRGFLKAVKHNYTKAYSLLNQEAVLGYYSYTRSQTTIGGNGTAEEDTLRTFRILKRGLAFSFDVVCPENFKADLGLICRITRSFGTSRTRGTGAIKLELKDETPNAAEEINNDFQNHLNDNDFCEIALDIHNKSQLLVSQQVGKTQDSEDYIPGSFILGALADRFIVANKLYAPHMDENFRAIFLSGQVGFSDAYPCVPEGRTYWPCPHSLAKEKDKDRHFDLTDPDNIELIIKEKIQTKGKIGPYIEFGGSDIEYVVPEMEVEYHHARPDDRSIGHATDDDGKFYQFIVIKPDQHFRAAMNGKYRYLKLLFELLQKNNVLYLGKSRTAQYGKCECTEKIAKIDPPGAKNRRIWKQGEKAVITLRSDTILRNENGLTIADPELLVQEMRELRGFDKPDAITAVEIIQNIKHCFADTKKIGGYLGVWNMPKIQAVALAAGSELVCLNNTGQDIPADEVESHAFGCRTEEGFGKVRIDLHRPIDIGKVEKAESSYSMSDESTKAKGIVKHILDKELEAATISYAVKRCEKYTGNLSNSFIGRLKMMIDHAPNMKKLEEIQFGKRAWDSVKKLKHYWPLNDLDDSKRRLTIDSANFLKDVKSTRRTEEIDNISIILRTVDLEDYLQNIPDSVQDDLFKLFANHFLTLARLHNRKEVHNG